MNIVKVNNEMYRVLDVLSSDDFRNINDEFDFAYNHIMLKWGDGTDNDHLRMGLRKPDYTKEVYGTGDSLSDNFVFINLGTRLKMVAEHLLKKKLKFVRVNTNIQFGGQDSNFHKDGPPNTWTFLLFTQMEWDVEWGGEFVCCMNRDYHYIPYLPNTGCLFHSYNDHKGCPPTTQCTSYRTSIAFTFDQV